MEFTRTALDVEKVFVCVGGLKSLKDLGLEDTRPVSNMRARGTHSTELLDA